MRWKLGKGETEAEGEKGRSAPQVYFGLCVQSVFFYTSLRVENHSMTEQAEWEGTHKDKSLTCPDYMAVLHAVYMHPFCFPLSYLNSSSLRAETSKIATKYRQLILLKLKIKLVLLTFFSLQ